MSAASTAARIAEEIALALMPVAVDVFQGKAEPEILHDAMLAGRGLVLRIIGENLSMANAAVLLADLQALGRAPAAVLAWLAAHPPPDTGNPRDDAGQG